MIELSHDGPPDPEFRGDGDKGNITVALLHSASNLKGYEVVIKQLVDPENNEWRELETKNIWHTSGITEIKCRQVLHIEVASWTFHIKLLLDTFRCYLCDLTL